MAKYRDLPMDLADAALVRVAERDRITQVFPTGCDTPSGVPGAS
jgi:predicted nucleic acid-binding protein